MYLLSPSFIIMIAFGMVTAGAMLKDEITEAKSPASFYLSFPSYITTGTVRLTDTIDTPLKAITICYRLRLQRQSIGHILHTVFSYAVKDDFNNFISSITPTGRIDLHVSSNHTHSVYQKIRFERWNHVCTTWESKTGINKYFVQGKHVASGNSISMNKAIQPGGIITIGQEQDALGGGFDPTQAFHGDLKDLHLWDYVLPDSTISQLAQCKQVIEGNVLSWNNLVMKLENVYVITSTSNCFSCEFESP